MFKKLRDKVTEFINSEDGKVGVKTSLSLGLVGGGLLLMQSMFPSAAKATNDCWVDDDCAEGETCVYKPNSSGDYDRTCE